MLRKSSENPVRTEEVSWMRGETSSRTSGNSSCRWKVLRNTWTAHCRSQAESILPAVMLSTAKPRNLTVLWTDGEFSHSLHHLRLSHPTPARERQIHRYTDMCIFALLLSCGKPPSTEDGYFRMSGLTAVMEGSAGIFWPGNDRNLEIGFSQVVLIRWVRGGAWIPQHIWLSTCGKAAS